MRKNIYIDIDKNTYNRSINWFHWPSVCLFYSYHDDIVSYYWTDHESKTQSHYYCYYFGFHSQKRDSILWVDAVTIILDRFFPHFFSRYLPLVYANWFLVFRLMVQASFQYVIYRAYTRRFSDAITHESTHFRLFFRGIGMNGDRCQCAQTSVIPISFLTEEFGIFIKGVKSFQLN